MMLVVIFIVVASAAKTINCHDNEVSPLSNYILCTVQIKAFGVFSFLQGGQVLIKILNVENVHPNQTKITLKCQDP